MISLLGYHHRTMIISRKTHLIKRLLSRLCVSNKLPIYHKDVTCYYNCWFVRHIWLTKRTPSEMNFFRNNSSTMIKRMNYPDYLMTWWNDVTLVKNKTFLLREGQEDCCYIKNIYHKINYMELWAWTSRIFFYLYFICLINYIL